MSISALVKADIKSILGSNPESVHNMDVYKLTSSQSNLNLDLVFNHMKMLGVKDSYTYVTNGGISSRIIHFHKSGMDCYITITEADGGVIVSVI